MDRLKGLLGGRAAEEIILAEVSSGAENDLQQATALARQVVCQFGMGESVGLMHCVHSNTVGPLDGGIPMQRDCSEATAQIIDEEVRKLLGDSYEEDLEILKRHRDQLERVAEVLLDRETLDRTEFENLLANSAASQLSEVKP
jgi:cell division protease FtsH